MENIKVCILNHVNNYWLSDTYLNNIIAIITNILVMVLILRELLLSQ